MSTRRAVIAALVIAASAAASAWFVRGSWHPRVLLIGIDGADPVILERLIGEGKMPTLARLRRDGAFGRLRSREPLLSPIVWTTIATGRKAQDHGILDFVEGDPDGRLVPVSSSRRRVPAVWNIATQFGHSSGFIGWYASFPVERVQGFEVSDRTAFHQVASDRIVEGATFPPDLLPALQRKFGNASPDIAATRRRFLPGDRLLTHDGDRRVGQLARIVATAEYYRRIAAWLQKTYRPELLGVYFEAVDACGHLFMEDAPPRRPQVADADYDAFSSAVDRCYSYQDEILAELLALAGDDTLTIICSDHGFKSGDRRPDSIGRVDEGQAALWHLPNGIVLMHGAGTPKGATLHDATILDIAPTVLRALGIPLARELEGRPLQDAWSAIARHDAGARRATNEFVPVPRPHAPASDAAEKLDELRALGYLSPSSELRRPGADGRFAASYVNEGVALYVDGEHKDALRAFSRAVELEPGNVNARAFAARVYIEQRQFELAAPLLDEAAALDPRSVYVRLLRTNLAISTGRWVFAEQELAAASALDSRLPMLHIQRARLLAARGHPAAALDALTVAASLTDAEPMLLDILVLRADAATQLGRTSDVEAALGRAAALAPADQIAAARAEVALGRGDVPAAVAYLRSALEKNPKSAPLLTLLGATYGRSGDFSRAIDAYERSVALSPTALACKTLAALVFEVRHDRTRAVELWEQSLALDRNQPDVREFLRQHANQNPVATKH